jgi:hypothetical protein
MKTPQKAVGASERLWASFPPDFLFKAELKPIKGLSGQIASAVRVAFSVLTGKRGLHA